MPSSRDLRALLKPLLKRRPDLGYERRALFFSPLTHYLRGVVFVQGWSSGDFTAWSFATPLFNGADDFNFGLDGEQSHRRFSESWKLDPESFSVEFCDHLERHSLPPVEPLVGPCELEMSPQYMNGYMRGCRPLSSPLIRFTSALGACYFGKFDIAERLLTKIAKDTEYFPRGPVIEDLKYGVHFWCRAVYLHEMLCTDRTRIPALLHDWEAYTVNALKLTKYWKPTPFPCEAPLSGSA